MAQVVPQAQQTSVMAAPPVVLPNQFVSTSLYVGDLDPSVSEAQLYEIFNQLGPVLSIRVCRDLITRKSLGYAYVNYNSAQDASRAVEMLNFNPVNGKPMRIMYSHRDPSIRKSGTANIFIKNLDRTIDNKALFDTFSVFGSILSCKIATDASGQSKGYGFVQYEQEESAQSAIEKVNGMLINDRQVFVGPFIRRQERDLASSGPKFNNVYVKNLAYTTTDEELRKVFGEFGPITSAVVMRDAEGKSKCFGFVNFENADDAAQAVIALNGKKVNEKEWYVGRAQKKSEREAELKAKFEQVRLDRSDQLHGANLYLKNLDDDIDDDKLRELFTAFGRITSCKVMRDPSGQSKGSGFVAFSSADEATRAVKDMNGKMVGSKPLYVALAQRKDERRARLQAQFAQVRNGVGIGPTIAPNPPIYHPGAAGLGQQVFYGQPPPGLIASQATGYGFQQPMMPGIRPGSTQMPNYLLPMVQRPGQQAQQFTTGRRGGPLPFQSQPPTQLQQPIFARGGYRGYRYSQSARNTPDTSLQGLSSLEIGGGHSEIGMTMPMSALASALASAPREQHRAILGEQLYPLVDHIEHDHAGKVTGMLLEMDQSEVLHLIESPEALKAKVAEAMEVLHMAHTSTGGGPVNQLAALSLNEPLGT
eukprot:c28976_g2_i1 orf=372-2312(+)